MVKFWIRISLEILEQWFLNLTAEMFITSETKWHLLCCCHDNWHKNWSFTPANLWWELVWYGNHVWSKQEPLSYFKGLKNEAIWFLAERDQESSHGNDTKGVIWFLLWCAFSSAFWKDLQSNYFSCNIHLNFLLKFMIGFQIYILIIKW